ncbi:MAG: DUF1700 domain-containing protein [Clostridia bacterium]|nr:DUF1700 domain-containing protein [Clostridia bacterium]
MSKQNFISDLRARLSTLPVAEVEERINFYSEMIDDRIEDGLSEDEAVSAIGNIDDIVSQIISEIPLTTIVKEKIKPKKQLRIWEIIFLAVSSPIWLSLIISAISVILSLYISLWSVIISLWAVFISVCASIIGIIASGILHIMSSNYLAGVALGNVGVVCTGLSIFIYFGCRAATKGTLYLTKKLALGIKNCFIKKEVS